LAGTAKQYSKKAIPQLTRITVISGADLYFRCPYHANVMNTFDAVRRRIGASHAGGRNEAKHMLPEHCDR